MKTQAGFTVIELLVVITIIAVLSSLFGIGMLRSVRTSELNNAAYQMAADLRRARSLSQVKSIDGKITFSGNSYTITQGTLVKQVTLPYGVTLSCGSSTCGTTSGFTYSAPYGEIDGTGSVYTLKSPNTAMNIPSVDVRVVGVTGKVTVVRTSQQ